MTQAEKLLRSRPNTRGIFVTSAIMTLSVIEATENFPVMIVGVDTQLALIGRKKLREDFFHAFDTASNLDKLFYLACGADLPTTFQAVAAMMIVPKNWLERENFL